MRDDALTALQREVLGVFFALPESAGFVLAGGAALIASGLSERPTQDVDLFTGDLGQGITDAADATLLDHIATIGSLVLLHLRRTGPIRARATTVP